MNEVIREHKLPFERAEGEIGIHTSKGLRKYSNLAIWYRKPERIACLIELKLPLVNIYDSELTDRILQRALLAKAPFFAIWNLNKFVLWEVFEPGIDLFDRRLKHWDVVNVKLPTDIKKTRVEKAIKSFILEFLTELAKLYKYKLSKSGTSVIPKLYPDEIMVLKLRSIVDTLYIPFSLYFLKKMRDDYYFHKKIVEWATKQGWLFRDSEENYDRLARQMAYFLINELLFYNVLKSMFRLEPIDIDGVKTGNELKERLRRYFDTGIKLGYGMIFSTDFLKMMPIPDVIVNGLKKLIVELNKCDFSKIGYDVVGKVFEKLIPKDERHKLGQYFTRTDVVDLILSFTVKHPDAKVLDPACGSGTFLVRAYQRKKYLARKLYRRGSYNRPYKPHNELIDELWGVDIAKFPAHLSEINLLIRDLEAVGNRPNIICKDFFEIRPKVSLYKSTYKVPETYRSKLEVELPVSFDTVVTNPPYTRQEEMEDAFTRGYKERVRELIRRLYGINVGKRSSIYAYFFYHGGSFLKEGGRMGLITSNSWLDVDYGKRLQEYFLKNFKIVAIIESRVERWFEDADIVTAITILEKCSDKEKRDRNLVKFVQLKTPLRDFSLGVEDGVEERYWETLDGLVELIEGRRGYYEDTKIRIFPKKQAELWNEGYDSKENRYVGSKWGKYIRAPSIFFKILSKSGELFVPLKEFAIIKRGFTTGADDFFYVTMEEIKKWGIEKEFYTRIENGKVLVNYVFKSPKEAKYAVVRPTDLRYIVLLINKDKDELKETNILKYIMWGEERGYNKKPTCRGRKRWYDLGLRKPAPLIWMKGVWKRHITFLNEAKAYVNQQLYELHVKDLKYLIPLAAYLNSTLKMLFSELWGRVNFGQGVLWIATYEAANHPVIDLRKVSRRVLDDIREIFYIFSKRPVGNVFEEILGVNLDDKVIEKLSVDEIISKVDLKRVKPSRLELDSIFFDILDLTEKERLEVYKAVIELVSSRVKRSLSVRRKIRY